MSDDRELLQLAAKAIGLEGYEWDENPFDRGLFKRNFEDCGLELQTQSFNPLDDDGDALRLAVKMGFEEICWFTGAVTVNDVDICASEEFKGDPLAATRRAITRAAAEIGKAMP